MPRNPLIYLWAFPNTCVGMLVLVLASIHGRVQMQIVDGVLELHGGLVSILLSDWTLLSGGASALTLGHVVLGRDEFLLDLTREHERVHVRQCERWGPLFIPAYLLSSLVLWLCGRDAYYDNPFEREAYDLAG